jgi:hypothetical protein
MNQKIAPLFASDFVRVVKDFIAARIFQLPDGGWKIENKGFCRTVRLDNTKKYPNLEKSSDILGFGFLNDSLYVYLNEKPSHCLYLTDTPPTRVYVKNASHYLSQWQTTSAQVALRVSGQGPFSLELANLLPNRVYSVVWQDGSTPQAAQAIQRQEASTDSAGNLTIQARLSGYRKTFVLTIVLGGNSNA